MLLRLPDVLYFPKVKKRRSHFLLIHTDCYRHGHAPKRKAEDEEIIWGEEWETPCRLSWAGAQRSSSVPVGPIPTRITTGPVHSDSSTLSVYLGSQPHRNPLHPSTLTLLPPLEAPNPTPSWVKGLVSPCYRSFSAKTLIARRWRISTD